MAKRPQGKRWQQKPPKKKRPVPMHPESLSNNHLNQVNPKAPAAIADLQHLYSQLRVEMDRLVKLTELKLRMEIASLTQEHNATRANQVVLQTMLKDCGIIKAEEFQERFATYLTTRVGVVVDGQMDGVVAVDLFNIRVDRRISKIQDATGEGPKLFIEN